MKLSGPRGPSEPHYGNGSTRHTSACQAVSHQHVHAFSYQQKNTSEKETLINCHTLHLWQAPLLRSIIHISNRLLARLQLVDLADQPHETRETVNPKGSREHSGTCSSSLVPSYTSNGEHHCRVRADKWDGTRLEPQGYESVSHFAQTSDLKKQGQH